MSYTYSCVEAEAAGRSAIARETAERRALAARARRLERSFRAKQLTCCLCAATGDTVLFTLLRRSCELVPDPETRVRRLLVRKLVHFMRNGVYG